MTVLSNVPIAGEGMLDEGIVVPPVAELAHRRLAGLSPWRVAVVSAARSAIHWPGRAWGAVDMAVAAAAFWVGHQFTPYFQGGAVPHYNVALGGLAFAILVLFLNYAMGGYDRQNFTSVGRMAGRVIAVNVLALAATSVAFGWLGYVQIGRLVLLWALIASAGGTFACRMLARELARSARMRLLFIGPKDKFRPLAARMRQLHSAFYERPLYLETAGDAGSLRGGQVADFVKRYAPDEVVVMDGDPSLKVILDDAAAILRSGCAIQSYANYYERLLGEVCIDNADERNVIGKGFGVGSMHTGLAKRPVDTLLALVGLVAGSPLMLICAVLVKVTSPGPILYRQTRVGRYGRPFSIYKFRTMRTDAEADGVVWASTRDSRVTPVGRFLRRTRFDELPQLWNILRGDMSLVGPRPERPEFVEQLRRKIPHYELRHLVPPGLTGWAQVRFRYGATVADAQRKLAFDLFYVRHCSLTFDVIICLRTLVAMAKGAR